MNERIANRQAQVLLEVVGQVDAAVEDGMPADLFLERFYRAHREYGSRDRRLISAAVFAWFRWRGWITALSDRGCAIVTAWMLDGAELKPAIAGLAERAGLNNINLKPLQDRSLALKVAAYVSIFGLPLPDPAALTPSWALQKIFCPKGASPDEHRLKWLASLQARPPTWLRARRGKTARTIAMLSDQNTEIHAAVMEAIRLSPGISAGQLAGLQAMAEIQDLASQAVGLICDPQPGSRWWDVCAGSGGKALHLADLMEGKGEIIATDVRPAIIGEARRRIDRNGCGRIIELVRWSGNTETLPRADFDGALVDAPCSGLGTWHRNPDARWRTAAAAVESSAEIQRRLLDLAAGRVKDGGRLVYSVCTLTAAETVEVVEVFLRDHPEWHGDPFEDPLAKSSPKSGSLWIWPWAHACNGMFIARLRRN